MIALRKARRKKRAVSNVKKRGRFACNDVPQARAEAACGLCRAATVETARMCRKPAIGARFSETPSVSRDFSPCLTFWYFWVKPKVQRKTVVDFLSAQRPGSLFRSQPSTRIFFHALSFEERAKEDREAKMVGKPPRTSLNDHERLRCFARSFRALGVQRLLHPTFSHRGDHAGLRPAEKYKNTRSHNSTNRPILALYRNSSLFASQRPARTHCEKRGKRDVRCRTLKNGAGLLANPRQAPVLVRHQTFPATFRCA